MGIGTQIEAAQELQRQRLRGWKRHRGILLVCHFGCLLALAAAIAIGAAGERAGPDATLTYGGEAKSGIPVSVQLVGASEVATVAQRLGRRANILSKYIDEAIDRDVALARERALPTKEELEAEAERDPFLDEEDEGEPLSAAERRALFELRYLVSGTPSKHDPNRGLLKDASADIKSSPQPSNVGSQLNVQWNARRILALLSLGIALMVTVSLLLAPLPGGWLSQGEVAHLLEQAAETEAELKDLGSDARKARETTGESDMHLTTFMKRVRYDSHYRDRVGPQAASAIDRLWQAQQEAGRISAAVSSGAAAAAHMQMTWSRMIIGYTLALLGVGAGVSPLADQVLGTHATYGLNYVAAALLGAASFIAAFVLVGRLPQANEDAVDELRAISEGSKALYTSVGSLGDLVAAAAAGSKK